MSYLVLGATLINIGSHLTMNNLRTVNGNMIIQNNNRQL